MLYTHKVPIIPITNNIDNELLIQNTFEVCYAYILHGCELIVITRCTRGVRVVFSVTRMRSSDSARMNKSDFTNEKIV